MKYVTILGVTIYGNKGGEAMLSSIVHNLHECKFTLLSIYPEQDKKLNNYKNLRIISCTPIQLIWLILLSITYRVIGTRDSYPKTRNQAVAAIIRSDLVIDSGGLSFVDDRPLQLLYNIAIILLPIILGKKIIKLAQSMGPFHRIFNRISAVLLLPHVDCIIARGNSSYAHLKSLGLKNVRLGTDAAFLQPRAQSPKHITGGKFLLGISPSTVVENYCQKQNVNYKLILRKFIEHLDQKKFDVMLIPHAYRPDSSSRFNNDYLLCTELQRAVKTDNCHMLTGEFSSAELRSYIGRCDIFITSRFHAMISSLACSVPTLVIGWNYKYEEILQLFSLERNLLGHKNLTFQTLLKKFWDIHGEMEEQVRLMKSRQAIAMKLAEVNFIVAKDMMKNGS